MQKILTREKSKIVKVNLTWGVFNGSQGSQSGIYLEVMTTKI